jgi:hypothetical protein
VGYYDYSANGIERFNAYLVGRDLFIKRNLSIDTFLNFIKWRGVLLITLFMLGLVTIILLCFILFMAISNGALAYALMAVFVIFSILGVLGFLQSKFFLNYSQTKYLLRFLQGDEANKAAFIQLDQNVPEAVAEFQSAYLLNRSYGENKISDINLNRTEKLLLMDYLAGDPGGFNDGINKLYHYNPKLSKKGIFTILGEILNTDADNIRKGLPEIEKIRTQSHPLSAKRKQQLVQVQEIFKRANFMHIVNEIEERLNQSDR